MVGRAQFVSAVPARLQPGTEPDRNHLEAGEVPLATLRYMNQGNHRR